MARGYYRKTVSLLFKNGYVRIYGGKGSHEKWHRQATRTTVMVPYHLDDKHIANGILKAAGIAKRF